MNTEDSINTLASKIKNSCNVDLVITDELKEMGNYNFHNQNKNNVKILMNCGCEKVMKISSLYNAKKATCCVCKKLEQYGYNQNTKERTCKNCKFVHQNIPDSNHAKFKCCFCVAKIKKEADLMKFLFDKGYNMIKNYRYVENKGSLTGDLYFELNGKTYIIEVDEESHLNSKRKIVHIKKDDIILNEENKVLFHVHKDDINEFAQKFDELIKIGDEQKIIVFRNTEKTVAFYNKIYERDPRIVLI